MVIKERIAHLRKVKNMSREELATAVDVHLNIIGRYERGETKPSLEAAIKLAAIFGVSLDYLVGTTNKDLNKDFVNQILEIQNLPEAEQKQILFTLGALVRDAKARQTYFE